MSICMCAVLARISTRASALSLIVALCACPEEEAARSCEDSAGCGANEICWLGVCRVNCVNPDIACPDGQTCQHGVCLAPVSAPRLDAGAEDGPLPDSAGRERVAADAGPVPDGAVGGPCPPEGCHPDLYAVAIADGGCICYLPCAPAAPPPRCEGWTICAALRQQLPDGGSFVLDAGVCLPAGAPDEPCAPAPCAELLECAHLATQDAGNTCRYTCSPALDAGVADAAAADMIPLPGACPPGQRCFTMGGETGACFPP